MVSFLTEENKFDQGRRSRQTDSKRSKMAMMKRRCVRVVLAVGSDTSVFGRVEPSSFGGL
jgi:hypothetical protein